MSEGVSGQFICQFMCCLEASHNILSSVSKWLLSTVPYNLIYYQNSAYNNRIVCFLEMTAPADSALVTLLPQPPK